MDIADFAGGGRVDLFAIAFDPGAIARCPLVAQRPRSHGAGLAVGSASDCEEHLVARLVYQSLGGCHFSPERLAVDLPITSEETLAIVRTRAVLAVHLVRVRGAQFALQLPQ